MSIEKLNAMIATSRVYRLTTDARYLILVNETEWTDEMLETISDELRRLCVKAMIVGVPDVQKSIGVFKFDPSVSAGELRPVEAKRVPLTAEEKQDVPPALRLKVLKETGAVSGDIDKA